MSSRAARGNVTDPKGYYAILEISPSASESEIKKAYKKLAVRHHPGSIFSFNIFLYYQ